MADRIIRIAFPFRDERLFPAGWRSFYDEIISINLIELETEYIIRNKISGELTLELIALNDVTEYDPYVEIISVNDLIGVIKDVISINDLSFAHDVISINNIAGELTLEIISVNDLSYPIVEIVSINDLSFAHDVISINNIAGELTLEIISVNYLADDIVVEILSKNDFFERDVVSQEIISISTLQEALVLQEYEHTLSFLIDNVDVSNYIASWEIKVSEDNYTNIVSLVFASGDFFSDCDPSIRIGQKRIKVTIDGIDFEFMLERRTLTRNSTENAFVVWGRAYISTLDLPYAIPIQDKEVVKDVSTGIWSSPSDPEYVPNIWQIGDCMVSNLMEDVIGGLFTLDFQIDDSIVRQGSFTAKGETPISIVNKFAGVIGAHVRTDLDDKVVVKYWKHNVTGDTVATFTDQQDIFLLDEKISFPGGYNKVLIRGYEDPITETSKGLDLMLDADLNNEKTIFNWGDTIWIRLYKSPFNAAYAIKNSLGTLVLMNSGVNETVTKELTGFTDKTMQAQKPINSITSIQLYDCSIIGASEYSFIQGYRTITSEGTVEDEPAILTYTSKYDLYRLNINVPCSPLPVETILSRITAETT